MTAYVGWVDAKHVAASGCFVVCAQLMGAALPGDDEDGGAWEVRLAAAQCLLAIASRKFKDEAMLTVLFGQLEPLIGAARLCVQPAECVAEGRLDDERYLLLKQLASALAMLGTHQLIPVVCSRPSVLDSPALTSTLSLYFQAIAELLASDSLSVAATVVPVWVSVFRSDIVYGLDAVRANVDVVVRAIAQKFVKDADPGGRDGDVDGDDGNDGGGGGGSGAPPTTGAHRPTVTLARLYSQCDFDTHAAYQHFYGMFRPRLVECMRSASQRFPLASFACVTEWLRRLLGDTEPFLAASGGGASTGGNGNDGERAGQERKPVRALDDQHELVIRWDGFANCLDYVTLALMDTPTVFARMFGDSADTAAVAAEASATEAETGGTTAEGATGASRGGGVPSKSMGASGVSGPSQASAAMRKRGPHIGRSSGHAAVLAVDAAVVNAVTAPVQAELRTTVRQMLSAVLGLGVREPCLTFRVMSAVGSLALYVQGEEALLRTCMEALLRSVQLPKPEHGDTSFGDFQYFQAARRKGASAMVRLTGLLPRCTAPLFGWLWEHVQAMAQAQGALAISEHEKTLLVEALVIISNSVATAEEQRQFIGMLLEGPSAEWTAPELTAMLSSGQQFGSAIGLLDPEAAARARDQRAAAKRAPSQEASVAVWSEEQRRWRWKIAGLLNFFMGVLRRATPKPAGSTASRTPRPLTPVGRREQMLRRPAADADRDLYDVSLDDGHPCAAHVAKILPNLLALIRALHQLWAPGCVELVPTEFK